jgi:putative ABC transport system permease protein
MGAGVITIVRLLSLETLLLVMIACLIAIPLAWYGGNEWLNTFAYPTQINPSIFLIAFLIAITISFITISMLTVKAAISNPVKSLRYE